MASAGDDSAGAAGTRGMVGVERGAQAAKGTHAPGWQERVGKASAGQGHTGLSLSGCRAAPGRSHPSSAWQRCQQTTMLLLRGCRRHGNCPTSLPGRSPGCEGSAGSGSAGDAIGRRGRGGERGEKRETVREAAGEVPPKPQHPAEPGPDSPFCCRASCRLASMSCSVAARLRGRLPAGLGGPWAGRQVVSCGDGGLAPGVWPPSSHTLGEGLRPSMERLSCEDEGVPLFSRGLRAPVSPSVLAR